MKAYEAGTLRADLERAHRSHPHSASTTRALHFGTAVFAWRTFIRTIPDASGAVTTPRAKAIGNLRDGDDRRFAMLYRLTIDMPDAQAALEQFGDRSKWGGARHDDVGRAVGQAACPTKERLWLCGCPGRCFRLGASVRAVATSRGKSLA